MVLEHQISNMHRNLLKFGRVVSGICERTDGQTDNKLTHHRIFLYKYVSSNSVLCGLYAMLTTATRCSQFNFVIMLVFMS